MHRRPRPSLAWCAAACLPCKCLVWHLDISMDHLSGQSNVVPLHNIHISCLFRETYSTQFFQLSPLWRCRRALDSVRLWEPRDRSVDPPPAEHPRPVHAQLSFVLHPTQTHRPCRIHLHREWCLDPPGMSYLNVTIHSTPKWQTLVDGITGYHNSSERMDSLFPPFCCSWVQYPLWLCM